MSETMPIVSIVWLEEIEKVRQDQAMLRTTCFAPEEESELRQRHIRSTAGRVALKRAIASLFQRQWQVSLQEKDIVVVRAENGRPFLDISRSRIDRLVSFDAGRLFLSISHSRTMAYGLVAYQRQTDG